MPRRSERGAHYDLEHLVVAILCLRACNILIRHLVSVTVDFVDERLQIRRTARAVSRGLANMWVLIFEGLDKRWHGGPDMAVLAYANAHYARWRAELAWPAAGPGAFAENFTVDGVDEQSACLGDIWQVGEARLQISEPRKPCRNISRFWGREDLLRLTEQSGRFGWYLRVLREGRVRAGQEIELIERPHPEWTVARAMAARRSKARDRATAQRLAACPALGADWREKLLE